MLINIVISVIAVIAGVLMCFEGYKLFRLSLGIAGAVAGFLLGRTVVDFTGNLGVTWNPVWETVVLLLFALVLGIFAFVLYLKALIAVTTVIIAFWFYDDFSFLFANVSNTVLRVIFTFGAGLIAGVLIGVIVYFAQKWTISLFTAFAGARVLSGVLSPIIWSGFLSGEYAGMIGQRVVGSDVGFDYTLVKVLLLAAFCAAGFAIQLKTSKK